MQAYRLTLRPLSAMGTPMAGDTLFGQLCWTLRRQLGDDAIVGLLTGYTQGRPFAVVSDALPHGHLPLPSLPASAWHAAADSDRKALKQKRWLPLQTLREPLEKWQQHAVGDSQLAQALARRDPTPSRGAAESAEPQAARGPIERAQPHNTINRRTGTTGTGKFTPYAMGQIWLPPGSLLDVVVVLDEARLSVEQLQAAFAYMGQHGFGRDASIGLGKFELAGDASLIVWEQPGHGEANAWLTLGPCAPQGLGFCAVRSHWQVITRFGRHGDVAVQSGVPFKRPVLLARAGSVFWPGQFDTSRQFIGQGLGGMEAPVSLTMPETVHQGYAPVVPLHLPESVAPRAPVEAA